MEAGATPHETGIWPHFKAFPRSESREKLGGRKEESCLTPFLREEKHLASGPGTPPFSLTSASLPTEKEDGGLLLPSTSHGLSPGSKSESAPRTGPEESEDTAEALWAVVCVWGGTRGTAPQTTTHKCEMWHKKDGLRERAADRVRLRIMHVCRDSQRQTGAEIWKERQRGQRRPG